MDAREAAGLLQITEAELIELAGNGDVPNATLTATGWHFPTHVIRRLARAAFGPTPEDAA